LCNDRSPHGDTQLVVDSGRWLAASAGDEQHEGVRPILRGQLDKRCDWTFVKPASAWDFHRCRSHGFVCDHHYRDWKWQWLPDLPCCGWWG
jgi:hypothetical protein